MAAMEKIFLQLEEDFDYECAKHFSLGAKQWNSETIGPDVEFPAEKILRPPLLGPEKILRPPL